MRRPALVVLSGVVAALSPAACGVDDPGLGGIIDAVADTRDAVAADALEALDTRGADGADDALEDVAPDVADDVPIADTDRSDGADTAEVFVPPPCPWQPYGEGLRGGRVGWVGYDGRAQPTVYATTGPLLFRSADEGATWQRWAESETPLGRLAFVPDDPKGILAGTGSGLFASRDGGLSFASRSLEGLGLSALLVHPAAPRRVFAGTLGAGIFRSLDGGDFWGAFNVGVPLSVVTAFAAPAGDADVVLATVGLLNEQLGFDDRGLILRTANGGLSWTTVFDDAAFGFDVTFCDADTAYAAVRRGVAKSVDGGVSWAVTPGFGTRDVIRVVASADCETVYAAVYAVGAFRSDDGGETAVGPLLEGFEVEPQRFNADAMALDPEDPDHVFIANYAGLWETRDGAASWALTEVGQGVDGHILAASRGESPALWLASYGSGLWRRGTGEGAWSRVPAAAFPRDFIYGLWVNPVDGDEVYVSAIPDLWRSRDGGESFENLGVFGNVFNLARLDDGRVFAVTQTRGIYRLDAPDGAFSQVNAGLEPWATSAGTFIDTRSVLAVGDGVVLVGTNGRGILRSADGGESWEVTAGAGLGSASVLALVRSEARADAPIYALAAAVGIYRSDDLGQSWVLGTTGFQSLALNGLAADPGSDSIFVSTSADGIYRSEDGATWRPFDRYCLPMAGAGPLLVVDDGVARTLIGAATASRVVTHDLGPSTSRRARE